jgi:uncharacterized membrane protein YkoI
MAAAAANTGGQTMKRKIVIAAIATAALATGGTVTAFAGSDGGAGDARDGIAVADRVGMQTDDDGRDDDRDDGRDDRDDRDDRGRDDDGRDDRDDRDDAQALRSARTSAEEAVAAALQARPGTAESVDFGDEDDGTAERRQWEVDVLGDNGTWYEVVVDADSGDVVAQHADDQGDDSDDGVDGDDGDDDHGDDDGRDDDHDDHDDD